MNHRIKRGLCALCAGVLLSSAAGAINWGLWYGNGAGKPPNGEDSVQTLAKYGSYYMGDTDSKVIYLTFDCGYENGNTSKILDVLKKHHAPAAFFMVGDYLDTAPELSKRMGDEGHIVGNHTSNHPNMSKVSKTKFEQELTSLSKQYEQVTGRKLDPFYRPPEGSYTHDNLQWAQNLGYHTTLWSVAYADWDQNKQPSRESALKTLNSRVHPGAIVLLHAVSSTNAAILDELLTGWENQGYRFDYLSALPGLSDPAKTAIPSDCTFAVDGTAAPLTAYLIDSANYVSLRDCAAALRATGSAFAVGYDEATDTVTLTRGQMYEPIGTELKGTPDVTAMQARAGSKGLLVDDQTATVSAYTIDGANYVNLRDLTALVGGTVGYDETSKQVTLTSAN